MSANLGRKEQKQAAVHSKVWKELPLNLYTTNTVPSVLRRYRKEVYMVNLSGISWATDILYGKRPIPTYPSPDKESTGFQDILDQAIEERRAYEGDEGDSGYTKVHQIW